MNDRYRALDRERDWYFFHPSAPISEDHLSLIHPLTEDYSERVWIHYVGSHKHHPALLESNRWPRRLYDSRVFTTWTEDWNRRQIQRVARFLSDYIAWSGETNVLFFWSKTSAVESKWKVFLAHWINFLFMDEGPFLFQRDELDAVMFCPTGKLYIGKRPRMTRSKTL